MIVERIRSGSCKHTRERLSDVIDGELHGLRGRRVRRHLLHCAPCRAVRDSLARAVEQLRRLAADPGSEFSTADAVVARLRTEGIQEARP
jgi:predicted anti-sigma-YlaC factor YlaD